MIAKWARADDWSSLAVVLVLAAVVSVASAAPFLVVWQGHVTSSAERALLWVVAVLRVVQLFGAITVAALMALVCKVRRHTCTWRRCPWLC